MNQTLVFVRLCAEWEAACISFQRSNTYWGHCVTHSHTHKVLLSWLAGTLDFLVKALRDPSVFQINTVY